MASIAGILAVFLMALILTAVYFFRKLTAMMKMKIGSLA